MDFSRLLFILNPKSGTNENSFQDEIKAYFTPYPSYEINFYLIDWHTEPEKVIKTKLNNISYDAVIASGGDGTVRFVAKILYGKNIKMGILPTGSANGLAQNLKLPLTLWGALDVIRLGKTLPVSSLTVNNHFCIHLADIGLNAAIVKRFEQQKTRGIWGYINAFRAVYFKQKKVEARIKTNDSQFDTGFYMLVFCNGTGYGTGLAINPNGRLDDFKFELVNVKKLSLLEGIRLYLGKDKPSPDYVKITSCSEVEVKLRKKVHIQVDGEYLGKVDKIEANLNDKFIEMIVPA